MANNMETLMQAMEALMQTQAEGTANTARLIGLMGDERVRREQGRTVFSPKELAKLALDLNKQCPTFERGRDRWVDFEQRIRMIFRRQGVPEDIAKEVVWNAIVGKSSKIVVASMNPLQTAYATMTLDAYLAEMAGKFTPASESIQMKTEYKSRKQGKMEDVQNYVNEKYELYKMAYPHANNNDMSDFYMETTKGIANRYVRSNLWAFEPTSINEFGQKAVFYAQVERQRIAFGDSDSNNMDGLASVTKTVPNQTGADAMEIDHLRHEADKEIEEDFGECECMAMHEQGFRGPCFYCQKKGHMARSCPRKSAGLPKIRAAGVTNQGGTGERWTPGQKNPNWGPAKEGSKMQKYNRFQSRKVNQVEEDQEERDDDEEIVESQETDENEVGFLGITL
jgi:hypothetical protein